MSSTQSFDILGGGSEAWPAGTKVLERITTIKFSFDFEETLDFIKRRLSDDFIRSGRWESTFKRHCDTALDIWGTSWGQTSRLYLQLWFADSLWELLFGLASSPSPWYSLLDKAKSCQKHGLDDVMVMPPWFFEHATGPLTHDERVESLYRGGRTPGQKYSITATFAGSALEAPAQGTAMKREASDIEGVEDEGRPVT